MTVILDQFIHSLVESGLMAKEEILAFIDAQPADGRPTDGKALAKLLFQQDKLTKFQIQCIYQGKTNGQGRWILHGGQDRCSDTFSGAPGFLERPGWRPGCHWADRPSQGKCPPVS